MQPKAPKFPFTKLECCLIAAMAVACVALGIQAVSNAKSGIEAETKQSANDIRIEQNEKCLSSHMLPELVEGEIVCTPDAGKIRIRQYFDYLYAEQVIREKTNKPLPPKFKPGEELPASKDNFESKQKKTD